jgi:predicted GIY-YIG superfamily endonuclease
MYTVYHIRPIGEEDTSKFYVGITKNKLSHRLSQHLTSKRPVGAILRELGLGCVEIVALHKVSKEEALQLEYTYRPVCNIGWNVRAGGNHTTVRCSGCDKHLPKRKTGTMCSSCNNTKFTKGSTPSNAGTGMRAILMSPDGIKTSYENLHRFCNEHGLIPANVRKVIKGVRKHTKGWKLVSLEG